MSPTNPFKGSRAVARAIALLRITDQWGVKPMRRKRTLIVKVTMRKKPGLLEVELDARVSKLRK